MRSTRAHVYLCTLADLFSSSTNFAQAFTTIFNPMGSESMYEFESKFVSRARVYPL